MKKTYTEQEVKDLMKYAWWRGFQESRYSPNINGSCGRDVLELLKDHNEEEAR